MSGLLRAAFAGVLAGLVLAVLDTRQAVFAVSGVGEMSLLMLQTAARLCLAGAVLGVLGFVVAHVGKRLGARFRLADDLGASMALALAASPGIVTIAVRLFQGGFTSRLPARWALVFLTALVLLGLGLVVIRIALALLRYVDDRKPGRAKLAVICVGLGAVLLGLRWCDAHLYKRLYLYLHGALGVVTLGGFGLLFRIVLARPGTANHRLGLPAFALVLVVVLYGLAYMTFERSQAVRAAAYERTTSLAGLLRITGSSGSGETETTVPDEQTMQRLRERARRERMAAESDWPAFPNAHILLITVDALRAERLGIYGRTDLPLTPNIDRWAKEKATVFERAYASAPHSSYSITALHTARFIHDEAMLGRKLTHVTLADTLNRHGYDTVAFYTKGIFFTEGDSVAHYKISEYDFKNISHGAPPPAELTDKAIAAIDRVNAKPGALGFFWVHSFNVHEPYRATGLGHSPLARYSSEIQLADKEIGRLVAHAEQVFSGSLITIISSDHGEEFKEHGGYYHGSTLYDEQVWVPLIIRVPGGRPVRVRTPVSTVGIAPTALKLVGITAPASMLGQDLRPAIFGGDEKHVAQPVFSSVMRQHMVVSWPFKLIADPSRTLYELYNLETDPSEKHNLYDQNRAQADALLNEIRARSDNMAVGDDPVQTALNLGHMRDVRAVPELIRVAGDNKVPVDKRVEAVNLLGEIRDYSAVPLLKELLACPEQCIGLAAACVLGDLGEEGGRDLMRDALFEEDPALKDRAALALGRLGDPTATYALVDALGRDDVKIREKAIRMLGRLGDPGATDALLVALSELRNRYLVVLALGKIGDPRAFEPLMDILDSDDRTDVRGYAVVALGWMEMPGAIPRLIRILREEPEIPWTPESLVRLGAVGSGPVFGTDAAKGSRALGSGFGTCVEKKRILHSEYAGRTTCQTRGHYASLNFFTDIPGEATVILRGRHLLDKKGKGETLKILVDGMQVGEVALIEDFQEFRVPTGAGVWGRGDHRVALSLENPGRFELDHLLVVER